jgi:uncharacterized damage-inducible protein DinB
MGSGTGWGVESGAVTAASGGEYNEGMVRLEHILESWQGVRDDTIAAVEEFPADELDFRAAPDLATFREIARHIVVAGDGLTGLMLAGDTDFGKPDFRERMKPHIREVAVDAGAKELAAALRESIADRVPRLAAQPAEYWAEMMTRPDRQVVTRLEMLQWVKEHELLHRQQLFTYLRMKGVVPVTTRRRLARQATSK